MDNEEKSRSSDDDEKQLPDWHKTVIFQRVVLDIW